jgi:phosphoserine phosphatase
VERVTLEESPDYIPVSERIAVFDNDGTLWSEKPVYFQFLFVLDRIHALAPGHPGWADRQPFKAVLEGDFATLFSLDEATLGELFVATHSGISNKEFENSVARWMETARHPETGRPYTEMVYQPMLELLEYLRAKQFSTYIVSGGGIGFIRPWVEDAYGIRRDQVVGTSGEMKYEQSGEDFVIARYPEMHFTNNKAGKPVGIQRFIGRRPVIAVGNSDGDYQMLQWTTAGEGKRLGILLHHTDSEREWAYDRETRGGKLDKGLDDAPLYGWTVIDMARDWNVVYPPVPTAIN